ncbi:hypothetical protein ACO0QE_003034 [Hanseniaspora vineae]
MGRLLGLELRNFKSYKGTVKVEFGDSDFISIIGPNGSGKSNLMDAVSFVLGVRSSQLRSSALKDLIYRGKVPNPESALEFNKESEMTDVTSSEEDASTFASVTAFYLRTNSEGSEAETVEFERSVTLKGESFYKINGKIVSYKSYTETLEAENILVKAKNFLVFQGDVEQVASQNALDLTKLFEQVSGSIQYKKRYEELNEQYKHALQMSSDGLFRKRRLQSELIHYKDGVSKDEKYKAKVAQRQNLWIQYTLWQLFQLEQKKTALAELYNANKEQIKATKKDITKEESAISAAKAHSSKDELQILEMGDEISSLETRLETLKSQMLPLIQNKRSSTRKMQQLETKIQSFERDVERQETILQNLERNYKVVSKTKKQYEDELLKSKNSKYHLDDATLEEYNSLKETFLTSGGLELEDKLALETLSANELKSEVKKFEDQINNSQEFIENLTKESEEAHMEFKKLTEALNDKNFQHSDLSSNLKNLQSNMQKLNREETQTNYKLRDALMKIDELSAEQRESKKDQRLRENVNSLRRLFPGVKGLVNELCKPKKDKYSTAIAIILGRNFDSVIVDSISTAQQCISYLKEQRAGSATFIPLDTVEVSPSRRIQIEQCILAIEALEYDPGLEKALQYVCGDAIICDDLEVAKDLKWNKNINSKLVTLNGSLIQKSGLMTGGVSKENSQNRWDKEEFKNLMLLKDRLVQTVTEIQQQIRSSQNASRDIELQLNDLNNELSSIRTQLNHNERVRQELSTQTKYYQNLIFDEYEPKKLSLQESIAVHEKAVASLNEQSTTLKQKLYAKLSKKVGFSLVEYEKTTGETLRKQSKEMGILQKELINIESKVSFERDRLATTTKRVGKLKKDLDAQKDHIAQLEEKESRLTTKIAKSEENLREKGTKLKDFKNIVDTNFKQVAGVEENLQDFTIKLNNQKKRSAVIKADSEKLDLERLNIFKNCQMTVIDLPLISGSLEDLPMDKIDSEVLVSASQIKVDYDYLDEEYIARTNSNASTEETINKSFENKINSIEEDLITLQPNTHAHDRLNEVQKKFDAISKEVESLKKHEKKLFEQFNEVKTKRKELFGKTFQHASEHIDLVYKELTKDPNSQVALAGGSASLTLEDVDEPYLAGTKYHATPPLKRFKEMEYLSGGEKTVAALALLFTINSYQPSPFFVLDEVDAALDVTNVQRVAAYIKRNANPTFQFIVISLKNNMFEKSDALVGVFRDQSLSSSQVLTLDLRQYAD